MNALALPRVRVRRRRPFGAVERVALAALLGFTLFAVIALSALLGAPVYGIVGGTGTAAPLWARLVVAVVLPITYRLGRLCALILMDWWKGE